MELPIPKHLQDLWEAWEIRGFILFSLFLQCFLILSSPLRKRSSNIWLYMCIWSAYLLADWVAGFAVGLISSSQSNMSCNAKKKNTNPDLYGFWASFLLVHLGGPDTITAFALEDNELWRRHMLTLIFLSISAIYVFYQTLPDNQLWMPTVLTFGSGLIKYGERTCSLLFASLDAFRDKILRKPDAGPNYAKLMDEYYSMKEANLPTSIKNFNAPTETKSVNRVKIGPLTEEEVVLHAYRLYQTFRGLIVDIIISFRDRNQCAAFFQNRTPEDGFAVIETELNFIYDVLFTKAKVVYNKFGCFFRFVCSSLVITSLYLFYFEQKSNYKPADVAITYTLLIGAIALDGIALIIFSASNWLRIFIYKLPAVNIEEEKRCNGKKAAAGETCLQKLTCHPQDWWSRSCLGKVVQRRWSKSVSSYNLIGYSRHSIPKFVEDCLDLLALTDFIERLVYVKRVAFSDDLRNHIFEELKKKSEMAEDDLETAEWLSAAKGDWALQEEGCNDLLDYVVKVDYDQSLILWHIATELCYWDEYDKEQGNEETPDTECNTSQPNSQSNKEFSKQLSDYMLYLLVMQPTMMSAVAGIGKIRFRDTSAEAKKFFHDKEDQRRKDKRNGEKSVKTWHDYYSCVVDYGKKEKEKKDHIQCCKDILHVPTEVKPGRVKGERSKSVLFDGCILAKELQNKKDKWRIMSRVWVEMLAYAAIKCRATNHAQQLVRGGELLTVVWLLMVQFGLGTQFQIEEGHVRAKLSVGK